MTSVGDVWDIVAAEKYCYSVRDGTHDSPKFLEEGHPLITSKNIKEGRIDMRSVNFVSSIDYEEINKRSKVDQWDVLISMIGTVGEVCLVEDEDPSFAIKNIGLFKCKNELDGRWLYSWLRSPKAISYIRERLRGTSQQYISLGELRNLPVFQPKNESTKARLIDAIRPYDDLIETNRHRIGLLEEAARLLYREWFVDLRYPGHLIAGPTELPQGWAIRPLVEVCVVNKASLSTKDKPEEIQYVDIASVETGVILGATKMHYADAPGRARRLVQHGDVIWSCVRPNRRSYALMWEPDQDVVVSTGFAVLTASSVPFSYLYFATTSDEFVAYLTNRATGAAYPAVSGKDFEEAPLLCPSPEVLQNFHEQCLPMLELRSKLIRQNAYLTEARDALLPKVMSGELSV